MPVRNALNECMSDHGGFEHTSSPCASSIRSRSATPRSDGPNLMYETRRVSAHCSPERPLTLASFRPALHRQAQPIDRRAACQPLRMRFRHNNHDIDDGLRSGASSASTSLPRCPFSRAPCRRRSRISGTSGRRLIHDDPSNDQPMAVSLIRETSENIRRHGVATLMRMYTLPHVWSGTVRHCRRTLQSPRVFLREQLYWHPPGPSA